MKFGFMKWVDRWVGTPICFALTLVRFLLTPLRWLRRRPTEIRRVVVIKFFGLGSLLMAVPMLRAIKARHPAATIHVVTFPENRSLLAMTGLVDEVITIAPKGLLGFAFRAAAVQFKLLFLGADAVLDLEYFSRFSVLLTYLSFAPIRAGFYLPQVWRGGLLTHKVYYNHFKHVTEVYMALAGAVGVEPGPVARPELKVPGAALDEARKVLATAGVDAVAGFIAVNANASPLCVERRWPKEHFAALIDRLTADRQVVLVGSPGERALNEEVLALTKGGAVNLAGATTLEGAIALLSLARLVITNDSGPLHLAAAAGAPVIALFGPETPAHYGPLAVRSRVFYSGVYCSPCLNAYNSKTAPCRGDNICMKRIGVDEVAAAAREELARAAN